MVRKIGLYRRSVQGRLPEGITLDMRTSITRRNQSSENLEASQVEQMIHNPSGWEEFGAFQKSKTASQVEAQ